MAHTTPAHDAHRTTTTRGAPTPEETGGRLRAAPRTAGGLLATVALAVGTLAMVAFPFVTTAALVAVALPLLLR